MSEHHILVIDDDERLRILLRRFLEESGFRVTDAGNASEARKILQGIAFDLLVVDIVMPGETGLEFLADIRKDNAVPALFLTAMSETENRIEGLEAGADDYMSKPFEPRELVLRIKQKGAKIDLHVKMVIAAIALEDALDPQHKFARFEWL